MDELDGGGSLVYILQPDRFLDSDCQPWTLRLRKGDDAELTLRGVLLHTLRRCPVQTGLDAMRVLDIREAIKSCAAYHYIALSGHDWAWMLDHFLQYAHAVWLAPEAAYLIRYLKQHASSSMPRRLISEYRPENPNGSHEERILNY